jgi:hypothetical protein
VIRTALANGGCFSGRRADIMLWPSVCFEGLFMAGLRCLLRSTWLALVAGVGLVSAAQGSTGCPTSDAAPVARSASSACCIARCDCCATPRTGGSPAADVTVDAGAPLLSIRVSTVRISGQVANTCCVCRSQEPAAPAPRSDGRGTDSRSETLGCAPRVPTLLAARVASPAQTLQFSYSAKSPLYLRFAHLLI